MVAKKIKLVHWAALFFVTVLREQKSWLLRMGIIERDKAHLYLQKVPYRKFFKQTVTT
jgi:hypothetical protein